MTTNARLVAMSNVLTNKNSLFSGSILIFICFFFVLFLFFLLFFFVFVLFFVVLFCFVLFFWVFFFLFFFFVGGSQYLYSFESPFVRQHYDTERFCRLSDSVKLTKRQNFKKSFGGGGQNDSTEISRPFKQNVF